MTKEQIEQMVNAFLCWKLPQTFNPDCYISFAPKPDYRGNPPTWPVGTNLFSYTEAKAMVEHMLAALSPAPTVPEGWRLVPKVPTWDMTRAAFLAPMSRHTCSCGGTVSAGISHGRAAELYSAMLTAAPQPPVVEVHHEPFIEVLPVKGDYCVATKWRDGHFQDPFAVGFYDGMTGDMHLVVDEHGKQFRRGGFRRVAKIDDEIGAWIAKNGPLLEASPGGTLTLWGMLTAAATPEADRIDADEAPAPVVEGWRDIASAPKNNTSRLVWCPLDRCIYCVAWVDNSEYPPAKSGWQVFGGGEIIDGVTHWQPLPAPPAAPEAGR